MAPTSEIMLEVEDLEAGKNDLIVQIVTIL